MLGSNYKRKGVLRNTLVLIFGIKYSCKENVYYEICINPLSNLDKEHRRDR